ncbi:MAG: cell filamentation protein Fic [Bacteroidales bacterium]|nr:cell filamentation protein Fic [Bacteroidales bacterium]
MDTGEILIYQSTAGNIKVDVRLEDETVWLTQEQMASLFGKGRSTITEHIINVFGEGELEQNRTCRNFRQVRQEGLQLFIISEQLKSIRPLLSVQTSLLLRWVFFLSITDY